MCSIPSFAKEDIEFVAEHLAEVPMDNRYVTLPIWLDAPHRRSAETHFELQSAYSELRSGKLSVRGPMLSARLGYELPRGLGVGLFVFDDPLQAHTHAEDRPLQTLFAPDNPLERRSDAHFSNLNGTVGDLGGGLFISASRNVPWFGRYVWATGLLWQRVTLKHFRLNYEITGGADAGARGTIDFDTTYSHIVPFVGIEIPRQWGMWGVAAHALYAMPLPRRGVVGHIVGPDFDLRGNTADAGAGKHFGDPSLTLGCSFTYEPAHLSIDLGAFVAQALLEPFIHRGIDRDYVLSVNWKR
jgi:hypothetical protein